MVSAVATGQTGEQDNRSGREKIMRKKLGAIGTLIAALGLVLRTAALTSYPSTSSRIPPSTSAPMVPVRVTTVRHKITM